MHHKTCLGFRVYKTLKESLLLRIKSPVRLEVWGFRFRLQGFGIRAAGLGCGALGPASGLRFRISISGFGI